MAACSSRLVQSGNDGARVHHRGVEEESKEIVAEIVVGGNVAPAPDSGVVAQAMEKLVDTPGEPGEQAVHALQGLPVARQNADDRCEIAR